MAEINPTDHKSISAHLFPDEGFSEAVSELGETERDNKQVEAEFSILEIMDWANSILVHGMDSVRLFMTQSSWEALRGRLVSRLVFWCVVTPS